MEPSVPVTPVMGTTPLNISMAAPAAACNSGRTRSRVGRIRCQSTPFRLLPPRRATQAALAFACAAQ
eukprot:6907558-Heterocapsa_arctica.AAC.1